MKALAVFAAVLLLVGWVTRCTVERVADVKVAMAIGEVP